MKVLPEIYGPESNWRIMGWIKEMSKGKEIQENCNNLIIASFAAKYPGRRLSLILSIQFFLFVYNYS